MPVHAHSHWNCYGKVGKVFSPVSSETRNELLSPLREQAEPPTERDLKNLSDDQVDTLYHQSLRALADQYRRGLECWHNAS
jgi:hypothetical protein